MDGLKAVNELNELTARLSTSIDLLAKYGKEMTRAAFDLDIAVADETIKQKMDGTPATLIDKIVKGHTARKRYDRDTAEVMYKTAQEQINALKVQIRVLENQIAREWGRNE